MERNCLLLQVTITRGFLDTLTFLPLSSKTNISFLYFNMKNKTMIKGV